MFRLSTEVVIASKGRGRPKRLSGNDGRDALITAAQNILRSKPRVALSRKALALEAGVTPALVYYHFSDQMSLIGAAAEPILETHMVRMKGIIHQDSSVRERLRALIILFLRIEHYDGRLLEAYVSSIKSQRKHLRTTLLDIAQQELKWFFDECAKCGYLRPLNTLLMVTVLWSTCKAVAQTSGLGAIVDGSAADAAQLEVHKAELIMDMLVTGFGSSSAQ